MFYHILFLSNLDYITYLYLTNMVCISYMQLRSNNNTPSVICFLKITYIDILCLRY